MAVMDAGQIVSAIIGAAISAVAIYLFRRKPRDHVSEQLAEDDVDPIKDTLKALKFGNEKKHTLLIMESGTVLRLISVVTVWKFASLIIYEFDRRTDGGTISTHKSVAFIRHSSIALVDISHHPGDTPSATESEKSDENLKK